MKILGHESISLYGIIIVIVILYFSGAYPDTELLWYVPLLSGHNYTKPYDLESS